MTPAAQVPVRRPIFAEPELPVWARITDALTVVLLLAALYVAVAGGVRIGTVFSMSTPWRALLGLTVICGLRHYLVRGRPLHRRVWHCLSTAPRLLLNLATGFWRSRLVRPVVHCPRRLQAAFERATGITVASALQIFALTALAVAQPLYDVIAREPAFFVARNTTSIQLGALAILIGVALPLVLIGIEAAVARIRPGAARLIRMLLLALLISVLLLPIMKRAEVMDTAPLLAVVVLLAGSIAVTLQRYTVGQIFLTALSPAALVVPAAFLMNADVRGALITADDAHVTTRVEHAPPIVFVVFDEFPANSLMNGDREIDRSRYPNFARLADDATWYRNTSTVSSQTPYALPAIVTGKYPAEPHAVPTRRHYPDNLFTLFSENYRMTVFGRFLQLCPAGTCAYDLEVHDTLWALSADLSIVFAHIIAPDSLAAHLPPIVGDWQGFAARRRLREIDGERRRNDRQSEYDRFLSTITSERSGRLYFLHTLTPHMPFEYVPSGTRYTAPDYQGRREGGAGLFLKSDPWLPVVLQQRHLLQVGFTDRFVGDLLDRLHEQGIYDESLVVVTADHGASFLHGKRRRLARDGNEADILLVPLLVKLPNQVVGKVSDKVAETVDILPTIADALSASLPYDVDGRSLLDDSGVGRQHRTFIRRNAERVRIETHARQLKDLGLEQKLKRFQLGLYALGPHASLIGRSVASLDAPATLPAQATLGNPSVLANVDIEAETLPLYIRGTINGPPAGRLSLAIGVNGVTVATTASYLERGNQVFASMIPEEALVSGVNEVQVVVLGEMSDGPVGPATAGDPPE